jgi:hypothetical protein
MNQSIDSKKLICYLSIITNSLDYAYTLIDVEVGLAAYFIVYSTNLIRWIENT